MKILIVSTFFPPQNSIASLRPYSWAKWWSRAGHDVTVLTKKKENLPNDLHLDCSGFSVIEIPLWMPFRKASKAVNATTQNNDNLHNNEGCKKSMCLKILSLLKSIYRKFVTSTGCFYDCRFPDWSDAWIKKAASQLRPTCCDLLVTTGGPYSVHRTAILLKRKGWNGKWILDWRDLWTKNHLYPGIRIFHPWERHLENLFHKNANYITTVSEPLAETLGGMTKTPVAVIYNGFDTEDFNFLTERSRKNNEKYTISYLGTLYRGYRDPEPLFRGLGELEKSGLITSDDIVVQFAGAQADVLDMARKYGVEKYYSYLGFLPREKALELQYDSDAVLFLEYENPEVKGVLTGKLFEYLYLSRKILAVGCSNRTSAGALIEKCNAGICCGKDVESIKEFILQAVDNKKTNIKESESFKNFSEINAFSRKIQAEKMLSLIDTVSAQ